MSDFYIGYLPKAPPQLSRRIRTVSAALVLLGATVAAVLVFAQQPFPASAFEFEVWRGFSGTIEEHPYPALVVSHPGGESRYWLVAPGKHGAGDLVRGLSGREVHLRAQLIYRGRHTMLEVDPASIQPSGGPRSSAPAQQGDLQEVTLGGEIVDTKCFFGVMNPGSGKVHRDCAARCISGGLPPALLTNDGELYLLLDASGKPAPREMLLPFVGEPVTIAGSAESAGGQLYLRIATIR